MQESLTQEIALLKNEIETYRAEVQKLQHNVDFKRNVITTLQHRCAVMEEAIPVFERRVNVLSREKEEKDKTIHILKKHVRELKQRNDKLENDLIEAYGRLDAEVESMRYCGYGCTKCDNERLNDLKNLFSDTM